MPAAKPESNVDKAIAYITQHPGARSPELAKHLGIPITNVNPTLAPLVAAGFLITCKVDQPGKPPMNEYRISSTVADNNVSWKEFRIARKAGTPLTKAPERPPRVPLSAVAPRVPLAAAAPVPAGETNPAEAETKQPASVTPAPKAKTPPAQPRLIRVAPKVVFMVDSTGQLRIEIPDHPPIVCSRDETRDAGTLLIATEPVWA